jgi:hypothetical protein
VWKPSFSEPRIYNQTMHGAAVTDSLLQTIAEDGYAFVQGEALHARLTTFGSLQDWPAFADSWNRLEVDAYMADGGRYRRRRHAVFAAAPNGTIERQVHQPHYQALDYNPLNGGVERWFEPVESDVGGGPSLGTVLACARELFEKLSSAGASWRIEVHQFRIEASREEVGRPTPEGLHRDGVDYVLVLLVDRQNIARGMTTIHALDGRALGHFTLTNPFDAALVDDSRVAHGVTAVRPIDPALPAHRDVLVVTFRRS